MQELLEVVLMLQELGRELVHSLEVAQQVGEEDPLAVLR